MAFTKDQPKDGDTILHCGHLLVPNRNWFKLDGFQHFERPNGTCGQAEWFVACDACFIEHGEDVAQFARGDGVWTGEGPIVQEVVKS
jgi:hypothetical protein